MKFPTRPSVRRLLTWGFALWAAILAPVLWAAPTCSAPNVPLTLPSATVPFGAAVGTTFGSTTTGSVTFTCSGLPTGYTRFAAQMYGLTATQLYPATLPTGTNITTITYATNVTGVGVQLTMSPGMRSYDVLPGDQQSGAYIAGYVTASSGSLTVSYTAQFIVTGTATAGTVNALTMGKYEWYIYGYNTSQTLGTSLTLNGGSQITLSACTVNTASQNMTVTLPTIATRALASVGATAGRTPFSIGLTCPGTGANVYITMATTNAQSGATGVVAPTTGTGYAANVGVQVLNGQQTAITFGTAQSVGVSASSMTIPYYAQYYETASPVSSGNVAATVTFTLSYQ
jgi:type 1 fimbria pilin